MSNKEDRMLKETLSHFADPRYSRKAWNSVAWKILNSPAARPGVTLDKNGEETADSKIEQYSYQKLAKDLAAIEQATGETREPTELDMILACQIQHARHNVNAATFVRDTVGAKPVDETKVQAEVTNTYEQLTDEELELLRQLREEKLATGREAAQAELSEQLTVEQLIAEGNFVNVAGEQILDAPDPEEAEPLPPIVEADDK